MRLFFPAVPLTQSYTHVPSGKQYNKDKGEVFFGQEPPSGESTTTECGFNYQLFAVIC